MEEETPVKQSVAQLAGRLRGLVLPMPGNIEKPSICPHPSKMKIKSSPIIEKLQANLALSPTVLLSPPKSPEAKQPPTVSDSSSPCSSLRSTLQPTQLSCKDELPVSFEQPAEGTPLPNINKSRARLSFKRRLPTRQHRKSGGEGTKAYEENELCQPDSPQQNGDGEEVLGGPVEEGKEDKMASTQTNSDPEPEKQEGDMIENRDAPQDNERTEATKTGNEKETSAYHQPSDCTQTQEPKQEDTTEDQTEMTENKELLGTETTPDEK